ncbi:hypothetical protein [uncultured Flavobacterium sp.]|uniref:hypothetical protein n=1 Tax=uncultured Flavobacterium sp. TaxID=165435 RepID=UPI0030C7FA28
MSNKVGIYISGLGQTLNKENVEKYALRIKNELNYSTEGKEFKIKTEKELYSDSLETTLVSIYHEDENNCEVIYKIYDFNYHNALTEDFKKKNILVKNIILLWLVIKKFPLLVSKLFFYTSYNRTYLTFYAFTLFFIISLAIIFLIPASIDLATKLSFTKELVDFLKLIKMDFMLDLFSSIDMKGILKFLVPFTTLILLIIPESKTIITSLATEFASVDQYLESGEKSQLVLGNLDLLIEYIAENNLESKIHFHCYSFGSLLAFDLLFPLGNKPSRNVINRVELLITTGNPYEFINAYYPNYFLNRNFTSGPDLTWLNIYSISDALATNFRDDNKIGEAKYGFNNNELMPINLNYEIAPILSLNIINFLTMHGIRIHKSYWDHTPNGQSCMRLIIDKMQELDFIKYE